MAKQQDTKPVSIDKEEYAFLMSYLMSGVDDLRSWFTEQQDDLVQLAPPDDKSIFLETGTPNLIPFDDLTFPKKFNAGLIPVTEYTVPVFPITIGVDSVTRQTVFYNVKGKAIFALAPVPGYDPLAYVKQKMPGLYSGAYSPDDVKFWEGVYSMCRLYISLKLIQPDMLEPYLYAKAQMEAAEQRENSMAARGPAIEKEDTNFSFTAIRKVTNGLQVTLGYPSGTTNVLDIYACTNIVPEVWVILATNLATIGTTSLVWTYTNWSTTVYAFGAGKSDADGDGDGIGDSREMLVYGTDETNSDSDSDNLSDGAEINTNGTDPLKADTDSDGVQDGDEIADGTNPLNPNDPPNVLGQISYSGGQTGVIRVIAVTSSNSWSTNASVTLNAPGNYQIPNLRQTNYWLKAFRDTDGDGSTNATEALGVHSNVSIVITSQMTNINIILADPDADTDSLPDWWENRYWGSITNQAATDDPDGDAYNNLEEYQSGTSPTNSASHPWNISGTTTYGGWLTGVVRVIAAASSDSWTAVQFTTNAGGAFTITHLPPGSNYWVKAFVDANGDASNEASEAWGVSTSNPVLLTNNATNVTLTLTDPDQDADALPDWWETQYGFNTASGGGGNGLGWWKLNEGSGTNVFDSSSLSNHGAAVNLGTNAWTAGVISNALTLSGTNHVQLSHNANLSPGMLSLSMWVRPAQAMGTNTVAVFFSKLTNGAGSGYGLSYSNGSLVFVVGVNGTACKLSAAQTLSTNWSHLVATYSGPNQALYVNGIAVAQTNYNWGTSIGDIRTNGANPRIGATAFDPPTNFFAGAIDDVQLDGEGWTSNRVHGVYQTGADSDGDGLSNWKEYQLRTNPQNSDTDGDGFSDGEEVNVMGTDPLNPNDGQGMTADARQRIVYYWNMIYPTTLTFTNAPGSAADLQDLDNALQSLSGKFYRQK
ncbi:MAG: LamG-like jellyroll fold domain-containing protein [bacterium]